MVLLASLIFMKIVPLARKILKNLLISLGAIDNDKLMTDKNCGAAQANF